ncbi:alpha/beta hydrolase [Actinoalloteichus fjordicus]|uniref:Alpha/beta hydrolase n=1 Tax=Actinoalloteichus fjordicus TaxID=1612552 RepID=A0AAC9PQI7_9PSEU|nr:alpha/beta hydrolase [Actinoalloteichus fjordicus]APU12967.1 Alpha/beta hydrolase [Actinoalloteichus fjordicus]
MMVGLVEVRRWQPSGLEAVFEQLSGHRDTLVGLDDELGDTRSPDGWSGAAAEAASRRHDELSEEMRRLVAGLAAVRRGTAEAADALVAVQAALADAEELARVNGFQVQENGIVVDVAPPQVAPSQVDTVRRERELIRAEVIERVNQVVRRAADIDSDLAAVLRAAVTDTVDDGESTSLADADAAGSDQGGLSTLGPPEDADPAANAGWWDSLSEAERADLLANSPELIGNLDGLPAAVRDEANRARLDGERDRLAAEIADLERQLDDRLLGGWFTDLDDRLDEARDKLAAVDAIENTLDRGDRQLLLFDLSHDEARAAVAVGDVDTADHVAVLTPGFTTTVQGSLEGYDDQMRQLQRQAEDESLRYGDGGSVATVAWLGYDAPQAGWDLLSPADAVWSREPAQRGAEELADFYRGIDASRTENPHLTALGHSYGSTTTGYALQQDTGVDDAIFFGSPGLGTSDVTDLRIPPESAYVIEARNDAVADLGGLAPFGIDPNQLDGVTGLSAREEQLPDGRRLTESVGHSAYLAPDSTSQYNISVIVSGNEDRAVHDDGRGFGDWLSRPVPGTY